MLSDTFEIDYIPLVETNYLINYINSNPKEAEFLFLTANLAYKSIDSTRDVYKPRLEKDWKKYVIIEPKSLIDTIKSYTNDVDIYQYDQLLYIYCTFTLYSAKTHFHHINILSDSNSYQFKIINNPETENLFQEQLRIHNGKHGFLYHGSRSNNWYSMLRNKIKITSNTYLMTTGAIYGPGIYMSDNFNIAMSYSGHSDVNFVGVFDVAGDISTYYKGHHVIPNENLVILRYIICVFRGKLLFDYSNLLEKIFERENNILTTVEHINSKRIGTEYHRLMKMLNDPIEKNKMCVKHLDLLVPDNLGIWKLKIDMREENCLNEPLILDMNKFNIDFLEIEIRFTNDYPMRPPYFRVVYPRFKNITGHITSGGSFCTEFLTQSGWNPSCRIDMVIKDLQNMIIEGKGRLGDNYNIAYSYEESKMSFHRVAQMHGWQV